MCSGETETLSNIAYIYGLMLLLSFFEDRNTRLRGSPGFTPADQCERFVSKFREMFPGTESAP